MPSNVTADPGAAGAIFVTRQISHDGDTSQLPGQFVMGIAGTEDAYTATAIPGDATNGLDVDVTRVQGTVTVDNGGTFATQATLQAGTAEIGKLAAGVAEIGNVQNAGTFAVQIDAGAVTSLALIDDAIFVDDTATHATGTTKVMGIGAVATPTDGSVDANDIGMPAMSLDRRLHVDADITASVALDVSAATITVINSGTFAVQEDGAALTALQLIDNAVSGAGFNITQLNGVNVSMGNGASGTGVQRVTIASDSTGVITVDNAGTFATQVDGAALTALQLIDDPVFADDAAFTLASSKVMMQGAIRDDTLGALTAVEGDAVPLRVGSTGALHVTGAGGGTQYTVDDAGPTVVTMAGAVRDDALTTLAEVDGDATLLRVSSTGALHVTGGGGGTEYTEDVATANPIVGTATLMERDDALSTVTPAEADWIGLRGTAEGALWVQDFNSDAILVDTTSIDGKITACDTGAVVIASGTITTISTVTNLSQMGGVAISLNTGVRDAGTQRVTIATDDLVPVTGTITAVTAITNDVSIDDGGNSITVDGTVAANATLDAETTKVIGTVRMASGGVASGSFASGSIAAGAVVDLPLPAGAATESTLGTIDTDTGNIATSVALIDNAVSGAGFNITQMNGVNLTMDSGVAGTGVQRVSVATDDVVTVDLAGNNDVQGDIAHDAVNGGNPFQLGAQAIAHGTNPTAVAAADRTRLYANRAGVPFMIGGHPNVVTKSARNTAAQTDTALVTIGAGLKIVVTRVSLTVDNSTTVDVDFEVGFGATTVPAAATGAGVAGMLADFMGVAAGGGITIGDGSGILGVGADGEDLRYSNTVPTTGNCTVTVSYYTIES